MSKRPTETADHPPSVRPEGRDAFSRGIALKDNPYYRGEDRWAWAQGWVDAAERAHKEGRYP